MQSPAASSDGHSPLAKSVSGPIDQPPASSLSRDEGAVDETTEVATSDPGPGANLRTSRASSTSNSNKEQASEPSPTREPNNTSATGSDCGSGSGSRIGQSSDSDSGQDPTLAASSTDSLTQSTLDFAKRDVRVARTRSNKSLTGSGGSERSNLGSRLHSYSNSNSNYGTNGTGSGGSGMSSPADSPPLHADDDERIRTPASAHPSRRNSFEIGLRQPFPPPQDQAKTSPQRQQLPQLLEQIPQQQPQANASAQNQGQKLQEQQRPEPRKLDLRHWDLQTFTQPKRHRHYEPAHFVLNTAVSNGDNSASPSNNGSSSPQSPSTPQPSFPEKKATLELRRPKRVIPCPSDDDLSTAQIDSQCPEVPLRQLREPRHPLYIPAVLRPTQPASYRSVPQRYTPVVGPGSTSAPGRRHWAGDTSRTTCAACDRPFTWLTRRHHCRKCGNLFCGQDSNHVIGLDRSLNFSLFGHPCRACTSCYNEFAKYATDVPRLREGPGQSVTTVTNTAGNANTGTVAIAMDTPVQDEHYQPAIVGSLVTATDWSTF